ncbi:MAG: hypothetical protein NTU44_05535 [Bacteroidetes bacterium]|nr:hypothetical protein [Bacteroidota bacterium]
MLLFNTTSRIGGGAIVKQFEMSGQMTGDSIFVGNFILSLTDPDEIFTVNGKVYVKNGSMNGSGTYSGYQPPDTIHFNGKFILTGIKE